MYICMCVCVYVCVWVGVGMYVFNTFGGGNAGNGTYLTYRHLGVWRPQGTQPQWASAGLQ